VTPFRDKNFRANGLLKQGLTRIAEITDGTSNTIAIAEDAARDSRFPEPLCPRQRNRPVRPRPPGPESDRRQSVAPLLALGAEADGGYGVSGQINNKFRPMYCDSPWQAPGCTGQSPSGPIVVQGNNAGANDEIFSYHPGGANALFGDGSVRFLKDTTNLKVLRSLVTLSGGEVISADTY